MTFETVVYLVDDDPGVLKALMRLLRTEGYAVRAFGSAGEFLLAHDPQVPGCVVSDILMPDLDGLGLQRALQASASQRFIVFITGHGDIDTSVQAMKDGAVDFLSKPFNDADFLAAVRSAIARDAEARKVQSELHSIRWRLHRLTPREHEVLKHVVSGRLNKQIAADLGTTEKTIKVHRARAMEKMGAASLAELVRFTIEAEMGTVVRNALGDEGSEGCEKAAPGHYCFSERRIQERRTRHQGI